MQPLEAAGVVHGPAIRIGCYSSGQQERNSDAKKRRALPHACHKSKRPRGGLKWMPLNYLNDCHFRRIHDLVLPFTEHADSLREQSRRSYCWRFVHSPVLHETLPSVDLIRAIRSNLHGILRISSGIWLRPLGCLAVSVKRRLALLRVFR